MRTIIESPESGIVDLWAAAWDLTVTPAAVDMTTRHGRRRLVRTRRVRWTVVAASALIAVATSVAAILHVLPVILVPIAAISTGLAIGATALSLRADAYRRFSTRMKRGATPAWWLLLLTSLFCAAFSVFASSVALVSPSAGAGPVFSLKGSALSMGLVAVVLSAFCAAATPPLLAAGISPRHYQTRWSQTCWTTCLVAITIDSAAMFLTPEMPEELLVLVISLAFGLIGAIMAWHARALGRLTATRRELLDRITAAIAAVDREQWSAGVATRELLLLHNLIAHAPFQSQSPAAPPPAAGWEIGQMTEVLLWAYGYADLPESVRERVNLEGPGGTHFRAIVAASESEIMDAGHPFLRKARGWLLSDKAADPAPRWRSESLVTRASDIRSM